MVLMENQVKMVKKEKKDLQATLENVSMYLANLLPLEKKEIKESLESQESLV